MPRRSTFTVNAEGVQGNAGATATFKALTVGDVDEARSGGLRDHDLLVGHLMGWSGIVDDDDQPLPDPVSDPGVLDRLYVHEQTALTRLLFQGPDGPDAKN